MISDRNSRILNVYSICPDAWRFKTPADVVQYGFPEHLGDYKVPPDMFAQTRGRGFPVHLYHYFRHLGWLAIMDSERYEPYHEVHDVMTEDVIDDDLPEYD